ncbi:MAG: nitrous oxide reductase accessory protein NosL [Campylobacterota bacterium]|nr:nitrous oxide reductase accessory protein NosL [Campylobacterota bacterium]
MKLLIGILISISLSYASSMLPPKAPEVKKNYVMDFTKEDRCVVRNFNVYKDPKWVGKIELKNGKKLFFSSPKSLIEFYHRPGKWHDIGVRSEDDFKDIIVTDYLTMKPINAKTAYFIYGSRATSRAGDDLVSIENKSDADYFYKKYSGKRMFKFNEVPDALIRLLNGRI